jgi:uncharacterized protein
MKVFQIKVKPNARQQQVQTLEDGSLLVFLRSAPVEGKANAELIQVLAQTFRVPKSTIQIKSGQTSCFKRVEIASLEGE